MLKLKKKQFSRVSEPGCDHVDNVFVFFFWFLSLVKYNLGERNGTI